MLERIKIERFALIESAVIPFQKGLNILSGETGAGKSIILDAIGLILGERARADQIRTGADDAVVQAEFDVSKRPEVAKRGNEVGLDLNDSMLIVKREISAGKSRIWLNGQSATLGMLQKVCEDLVDLCGQHENQSLFRSAAQLNWIDAFGGSAEQAEELRNKISQAQVLQEKISETESKQQENLKRLEFLQFQSQELIDANLVIGEDDALADEKKLHQSMAQRMELATAIRSALVGGESGESGILNLLKSALSKARSLQQLDSQFQGVQVLEAATSELQEFAFDCDHYGSGSSAEPERLLEIQERLALISKLKRKYGTTIEEILNAKSEIQAEVELLQNSEQNCDLWKQDLNKLYQDIQAEAAALLKVRQKAAKSFENRVTQELHDLKMQGAKFFVEVIAEDSVHEFTLQNCGSRVNFVAQTNAGETARPLQKIVSGGEMSRILLAIRQVLSQKGQNHRIGVFLFDEIDAGLGGQAAFVVGKKLKSVAAKNQVICITHVPQVACFADHHLQVSKRCEKQRTLSEIQVLNPKQRELELARMLGGEDPSRAAIKNAEELIGLAKSALNSAPTSDASKAKKIYPSERSTA